jgi:hypothetical protein
LNLIDGPGTGGPWGERAWQLNSGKELQLKPS